MQYMIYVIGVIFCTLASITSICFVFYCVEHLVSNLLRRVDLLCGVANILLKHRKDLDAIRPKKGEK